MRVGLGWFGVDLGDAKADIQAAVGLAWLVLEQRSKPPKLDQNSVNHTLKQL